MKKAHVRPAGHDAGGFVRIRNDRAGQRRAGLRAQDAAAQSDVQTVQYQPWRKMGRH